MHPGCENPSKNKLKKGYCAKHYKRIFRYGCSHTKRIGGAVPSQGPYCTLYIARRRQNDYWATQVDGVTTLVHRLIAEIILGRPLEKDEQVHHVDGNGLHNSESNIEVMDIQTHALVSNGRRWRGEDPF